MARATRSVFRNSRFFSLPRNNLHILVYPMGSVSPLAATFSVTDLMILPVKFRTIFTSAEHWCWSAWLGFLLAGWATPISFLVLPPVRSNASLCCPLLWCRPCAPLSPWRRVHRRKCCAPRVFTLDWVKFWAGSPFPSELGHCCFPVSPLIIERAEPFSSVSQVFSVVFTMSPCPFGRFKMSLVVLLACINYSHGGSMIFHMSVMSFGHLALIPFLVLTFTPCLFLVSCSFPRVHYSVGHIFCSSAV